MSSSTLQCSPIAVGDIIQSNLNKPECTIYEFYVVIKRTPKTIVIQRIDSHETWEGSISHRQGAVAPDLSRQILEGSIPIRKTITVIDGYEFIALRERASYSRWEGKPLTARFID